ncbi:hypothetical protein GF407_01390 [candidate division KSB1 bacterium]|nr:hypothetical protein [candidate division KSB1 bacterium]
MPAGDGTGPAGMGPMTGRAAGYCTGYGVPGHMNPGPGRGRGFGRGMRMGFRGGRGPMWGHGYSPYWYGAPVAYNTPATAAPTAQQEIDVLRSQAEYFENMLKEISQRIDELEKQKTEE